MIDKTIDKITVNKQVLMEALTTLGSGSSGMPNPDDDGDPDNPFGPYGPGGPVMRDQLSAFYAKSLTRRFIQTVVTTAQVNALQHEKAGGGHTWNVVSQYVDDFCGTKWPRPFPFPPNPPRPWWWRDFDPGEPRPIDLIAAGLEFYNAAKALKGTELQGVFEDASNKLIQTGLNAG
jgi:hypothetical protein